MHVRSDTSLTYTNKESFAGWAVRRWGRGSRAEVVVVVRAGSKGGRLSDMHMTRRAE